MIDPRQSVASLVLDHSACAPVLQRHRIDYCCKGERSLADACAERGLDPATVAGELARAIERDGSTVDRRATPTPQLVAHIVTHHHAYLREALPFLRALSAKVRRVHGDHDPRLRELDDVVVALDESLGPHLAAEEQALFPTLLDARADRALVERELASMREEHLEVGALLGRVRAITADFALPEWACASYRTLFAELGRLETDVLEHVHLEIHVLAPCFAAPEA